MTDAVLTEVARRLTGVLSDRIADRAVGAHVPMIPYVQVQFGETEYSENGFVARSAWMAPAESPLLSTDVLYEAVTLASPEVDEAVARLTAGGYDSARTRRCVEELCMRVAADALLGVVVADEEVASLGALLGRSIRGETVRAWVRADLVGVRVTGDPIRFQGTDEERILLRALDRADLELVIPAATVEAMRLRISLHPSAVLELEYDAPDASEWQRHLNRGVAVLQLFGVGGVRAPWIESGSDSLAAPSHPLMYFDDGTRGIRYYTLDARRAAQLPHFWRTVAPLIPEGVYWNEPEDPLGIHAAWMNFRKVVTAYGYLYERLAEAARSLESLLLDGRRHDRVSARLRDAAAALLGPCGYDPQQVQRDVGLAYDVRSRHYHGDEVGERLRKKVEGDADGVGGLLNRCLEYNRAALVACVVSSLDKATLLRALRNHRKLTAVGTAFRAAEGLGTGAPS